MSNALEAFLGTTEDATNKSISSQIRERAALLLSVLDEKEDWEKRVKQFYDMRSDLVHGQIPAFDKKVHNQMSWGCKIVHGTLMEALSWTLYLSQNNRPNTIQEIDKRFNEDLPAFSRGNSL